MARTLHRPQPVALIGLLSDSHGQAGITRRAVDLLVHRGARLLIHLGDIGSALVLDALLCPGDDGHTPVEARLVFGNTDANRLELARYARFLDIHVDDPVGSLPLPAGPLVFTHGDDSRALSRALGAGPRYLCHGHTHQAADYRRGPTRVINPGALFRTTCPSVALLDPQRDHLQILPVEPAATPSRPPKR